MPTPCRGASRTPAAIPTPGPARTPGPATCSGRLPSPRARGAPFIRTPVFRVLPGRRSLPAGRCQDPWNSVLRTLPHRQQGSGHPFPARHRRPGRSGRRSRRLRQALHRTLTPPPTRSRQRGAARPPRRRMSRRTQAQPKAGDLRTSFSRIRLPPLRRRPHRDGAIPQPPSAGQQQARCAICLHGWTDCPTAIRPRHTKMADWLGPCRPGCVSSNSGCRRPRGNHRTPVLSPTLAPRHGQAPGPVSVSGQQLAPDPAAPPPPARMNTRAGLTGWQRIRRGTSRSRRPP